MKFLRHGRGCAEDVKIRNETSRSDLNIYTIDDEIEEYKTKWKDHVDTMVENILPKKIMNYRPIGKRLGSPRKRRPDVRLEQMTLPIPLRQKNMKEKNKLTLLLVSRFLDLLNIPCISSLCSRNKLSFLNFSIFSFLL
jgi:hypothetical protein